MTQKYDKLEAPIILNLCLALKETKALCVPRNKNNEEDLPTVDLDYATVPDKQIMEDG